MHIKIKSTFLIITTIMIIVSFIYLLNLKLKKEDKVPRSATFVLNLETINDKYE